jgi:hypothetical protein
MASLQPDEEVHLDEFYAGGPATFQAAFPPVCIGSHWDPMLVEQHILPPQGQVKLALDPRQAVQVCRQYYTESPADALPAGLVEPAQPLEIPAALKGPERYIRPEGPKATPPGGAAGLGAPYSVYAQSVDRESDIYRLDERLTKCKELRYQPKAEQLAQQTNVLPNQSPELAYKALGAPVEPPRLSAGCREQDDALAWNRSARLFFNPTKLDRYHPTQKLGPMVCDPPACANPTQAFVDDKM